MTPFNLKDIRNWLMPFMKRPERLGLEIEASVLRIVRVKRGSEGRLFIDGFGEFDIDLKNAGVMEQQRFRSAIRQLGDGLVRVAVNMEDPSLRVRRMVLPKMPDRDLLEAVRWNFREQIEGSIDDYVVGFLPLETTPEPGRQAIIAFGVAQRAIKQQLEVLKGYGLKAVSVEPASTALLAAFHANGILGDKKHHVCVVFGHSSAQFTVMKGASLLFSRPLAGISHDQLVRMVAQSLNTEPADAEKELSDWMKEKSLEQKPEGTAESAEPPERARRIENSMGHFLSQLVIEVQRSIDAFCIMYGIDRIDDLYVCGGEVFYLGLVEHMQKSLGVKTMIFNPFERLLEPERQTAEAMKRAPAFAVAVGLAIP